MTTTPNTIQRLVVRENHGDRPCLHPAAMMELRLRLAERETQKPRNPVTLLLRTLNLCK